MPIRLCRAMLYICLFYLLSCCGGWIKAAADSEAMAREVHVPLLMIDACDDHIVPSWVGEVG